jgi:hypothetical protein
MPFESCSAASMKVDLGPAVERGHVHRLVRELRVQPRRELFRARDDVLHLDFAHREDEQGAQGDRLVPREEAPSLARSTSLTAGLLDHGAEARDDGAPGAHLDGIAVALQLDDGHLR